MSKDNSEERPLVYEVLFSATKDKEEVLIGPVMVKAKTQLVAIAKAAIEKAMAGEFKGVNLTSIEVKVRGF